MDWRGNSGNIFSRFIFLHLRFIFCRIHNLMPPKRLQSFCQIRCQKNKKYQQEILSTEGFFFIAFIHIFSKLSTTEVASGSVSASIFFGVLFRSQSSTLILIPFQHLSFTLIFILFQHLSSTLILFYFSICL